MKRVLNSQVLGSPRFTHELDQRCLDCERLLLGFSDGSGLCVDHGWFEPEKGDEDLYFLREHFDLMFNITPRDRQIASVLSMPQVRASYLTEGTLREATSSGINLRVLAEAVAHGLHVSSFAQAVICGIDCQVLNKALADCSKNNQWHLIPSLNAQVQAACLK